MLWWIVYLLCLGLLLVGARFIIKYLSARERSSEWFQSIVTEDYLMEFPDKEREQYEHLKDRIRAKHGTEQGDDPQLFKSLVPVEQAILITQLKSVMVKSIANLAQIQKDRPGCHKLWRGKLISEEYWESLCAVETEVKEDISETLKEAAGLKPVGSERFFDECLDLWRKQLTQKAQEDVKLKQVEQRKQAEIEVKQKEQKCEAQKARDEKEREKMLNLLILEDEKEQAKEKKKAGGKKRNKKQA